MTRIYSIAMDQLVWPSIQDTQYTSFFIRRRSCVHVIYRDAKLLLLLNLKRGSLTLAPDNTRIIPSN
jgi:hypothetical protein